MVWGYFSYRLSEASWRRRRRSRHRPEQGRNHHDDQELQEDDAVPYVTLACLGDHRGKVGSLERSAAHEARRQRRALATSSAMTGSSGTAVENADAVGELLAEHLLEVTDGAQTSWASSAVAVLPCRWLNGLVGDDDLLGAGDLKTNKTSHLTWFTTCSTQVPASRTSRDSPQRRREQVQRQRGNSASCSDPRRSRGSNHDAPGDR